MDRLVLTTNREQAILPAFSFTLKEEGGVMAAIISRPLLIAIKEPNTFGLEVPTHFSQLSLTRTTFYPNIRTITSETGKKYF
jgi:hypothetical protein